MDDGFVVIAPAAAGRGEVGSAGRGARKIRRGKEVLEIGDGCGVEARAGNRRIGKLGAIVLRFSGRAGRTAGDAAGALRIIDGRVQVGEVAREFGGRGHRLRVGDALAEGEPFPVDEEEGAVAAIVEVRYIDRATDVESILVLREGGIG